MQGLTVYKGARKNTWKYKRELWRDKVLVKTVYATLGDADKISRSKAELEAAKLNDLVAQGVDPFAETAPNAEYITLGKLIEFYCGDLTERGKGERYRDETLQRCKVHLGDWWNTPLDAITKNSIRDRHRRIKQKGYRLANMVMGHIQAAWNVGEEMLDGDMPKCPVRYRKARENTKKDYSHRSEEGFWRAVAQAGPMRAAAWEFALLSGLRPGNVIALKREWVGTDRVTIPRAQMKIKDPARPDFECPCTPRMIELLHQSMKLTAIIAPDSDLVFIGSTRGDINMRPYANVLRHWHTTVSGDLGIHPMTIEKLHDHSLKGLLQTYRQANVEDFSVLMKAQTEVANYFTERCQVFTRR